MHSTTRPTLQLAAGAAAAVMLLAACGSTDDDAVDPASSSAEEVQEAEEGTTDEPSDEPTDDASSEGGDGDASGTDDADDDGDADDAGDAAPADPLLAVTATAPDGSTFTIGDTPGRPVLVETFATWCSSCRRQLGDTQAAAEEAGDDVVVLALSVETDLDPASLADYATENGFDDVRFGVLDEAGLVALADRFGGSVLNPPATPKFRVAPDGTVSELTTGFESTQDILDSLGA